MEVSRFTPTTVMAAYHVLGVLCRAGTARATRACGHDGSPLGGITLSPDKTRAYQYSYDASTNKTYLTIVDADSGEQVGQPIELQGNGQRPMGTGPVAPTMQFTDNGDFALIRTYDPVNNKTYVTVVDNETGEVVDTPIEIDGEFLDFDNGQFPTVGNRVYVQTVDYDSNTRNLRSSIPPPERW